MSILFNVFDKGKICLMITEAHRLQSPALIVIDLQRDLCYDDRRKDIVLKSLPNIIKLINIFSKKMLPVYYTRFELPKDDPQFERFGDKYCVSGTDGAEFIDEILPLQGEIILKSKHSAFFGTNLGNSLEKSGSTTVILVGLQTQICILTTAADAYHRGLDVVVVDDAVISTRDEVRLDALEWIQKYVGRVTSTDGIVTEL